jgi:putative redox protein
MTIKRVMEEQVAIARAGDLDKCTERFGGDTRQVEGLRSEATFGRHGFAIDEPTGFGGRDTAANPAEVMLGALGASIEVTCRVYAEYLGIPLNSVSVRLDGNLDTRGFFDTDVRVRSGFDKIDVKIAIDSPAGPDAVARLLNRIERCCPVLDTIRNGTPVKLARV